MRPLFADDDEFDGRPPSEAVAFAELLKLSGDPLKTAEEVFKAAEEFEKRFRRWPGQAELTTETQSLFRALRRDTPTLPEASFALEGDRTATAEALSQLAELVEKYGADSEKVHWWIKRNSGLPEFSSLAKQLCDLEPNLGWIDEFVSRSGAFASFSIPDQDVLLPASKRCFPVMVIVARKSLRRQSPLRVGRTLVESALDSVSEASTKGKSSPELENTGTLAALLACAAALRLKSHRQLDLLDQLPNATRSPELEAAISAVYNEYTEILKPDQLRPFAERHVAGMGEGEIARQLERVRDTVDRKVKLIQERWQKALLDRPF